MFDFLNRLWVGFWEWLEEDQDRPYGEEDVSPVSLVRLEEDVIPYFVQEGDRLDSIAFRYGVTTELLRDINRLAVGDRVLPGQRIYIPLHPQRFVLRRATPPPPLPSDVEPDQDVESNTINYVVQREDTLESIAGRYGIAPEILAEINELENFFLIYPGKKLVIPLHPPRPAPEAEQPPPPRSEELDWPDSPVSAAEGPRTHAVQPGETLSSIALACDTTIAMLVQLNDFSGPPLLRAGQLVILPPGMSPPTSTSTLEPPPEPIPEPAADPERYAVYETRRGDTMVYIARQFGVKLGDLIEDNAVKNPGVVSPGHKLVIYGYDGPPPESPSEELVYGVPYSRLGPPDAVRAVYLPYYALNRGDILSNVLEILEWTEINAVVIDVKCSYGWISYPTQVLLAPGVGAARPSTREFDPFLSELLKKGAYTIGRISVFRDDALATNRPAWAARESGGGGVWRDEANVAWADPFLHDVWAYNLSIAEEAASKGFSEIQFDNVRFPMQTKSRRAVFSQTANATSQVNAISSFLNHARDRLSSMGVSVSAKVPGYACWGDAGILVGQDLRRIGQHMQILCPALFPSALARSVPGKEHAVSDPLQVVSEGTNGAVEKIGSRSCWVRPWIQGFPDYTFDRRPFGVGEIRAQVQGAFEGGGIGFMLWDPRAAYDRRIFAPE